MTAHISSVTFRGIETPEIDVQVQLSGGLPAFAIVGLPDKAVSEARERVRGALAALGLALPPKRITVNLSPADMQKEGSHFDLPIALGLLAALDVLSPTLLGGYTALGELGLDGGLAPVAGVLPAAVAAQARGRGIICPLTNGPEAAWAGGLDIVAAPGLLAIINHFKGTQLLSRPQPKPAQGSATAPDMRDVKGQETARRALEIAAAGGHNLLMSGPPGSGKSMLAARLPGLLPPLRAEEALETSMIHSVSGLMEGGRMGLTPPFRDPHHSSSVAALVGGGRSARPGEISLAHNGVLFLDELPEFAAPALEALRQPLESGRAVVARANAHVVWPARVQLVAAMNPCRCGYLGDPAAACGRAPACGAAYRSRISGPLMDRIDLYVEVAAVNPAELARPASAEDSATVAARVAAARDRQKRRFAAVTTGDRPRDNARADGQLLEDICALDARGRSLLMEAANRMRLSARGYHRVLRVARTLADLEGAESVASRHIAEALAYRPVPAALAGQGGG